MAWLLLILQLLGAIPQIIEFFKYVWELIGKIRDPKTRLAMRKKARHALMSSVRFDGDKPQTLDSTSFLDALENVHEEVCGIISRESLAVSKVARAALHAAAPPVVVP